MGKTRQTPRYPMRCRILDICNMYRRRMWKRSTPSVPSGSGGTPCLPTTRLGRAVWRFGHGQRGVAAIESALTVTVLVISLAVLFEIVSTVYSTDEMARASRAVARAVALDSSADHCTAVRRELHLPEDFDCPWVINVVPQVNPKALPATLDATPAEGGGELVFVTITWSHQPWSFGSFLQGGDGRDADAVQKIAMGLARRE